jgi:hypothetical protein
VDSADNYAFWSAFDHFGGVDGLGYPLSNAYAAKIGREQIFQRGIIQIESPGATATIGNIFSALHDRGADRELLAEENVPVPVIDDGSGGDPAKAKAVRLSWLLDPEIKQWYLASNNVDVAIARYGLPASKPVVAGSQVVQRFQNVAVQAPRGGTQADQVQVMLGGQFAAEFGLVAQENLQPLEQPPVPEPVDVTAGLPGGGKGPDARFGGIGASEVGGKGVLAISQLGLGWDREQFLWRTVDSANLDLPKVARGDAHLFTTAHVVGLLQFTPPYANGGSSDYKLPPQNLELPWDDPRNYWGQFVFAIVKQERGSVDTWALWNEPDICAVPHPGFAWHGTVAQFYRLMKVGYQAARAANPNATVLLGSLGLVDPVCQTDGTKTTFFNEFLAVAKADPEATGPGAYFDAVTLDLHKEPEWIYNLVGAYHQRMAANGFDKPVWLMEMGVPVVDHPIDPAGNNTLSVDKDGQESFIIQGYANAIAAGADHIGLFPMEDYPPDDPAFAAVRTAIRFMSNVTTATKIPAVSGLSGNRYAGVVRIVMDGPGFRTTVVYNRSRQAVTYSVPASAQRAILANKHGEERIIEATGGHYVVELEGMRGGFFAPWGEDVRFIGGSPLILREAVS